MAGADGLLHDQRTLPWGAKWAAHNSYSASELKRLCLKGVNNSLGSQTQTHLWSPSWLFPLPAWRQEARAAADMVVGKVRKAI